MTTADVCTIKSSEDSHVYCNMVINKQLVNLKVECGATVNVPHQRYVRNKEIRQEDVSLKMWNDVTMQAIGKCLVKTVNWRTVKDRLRRCRSGSNSTTEP